MKNSTIYILFLIICLFITACISVKSQKSKNRNTINNIANSKTEKLRSIQRAVKLAEEFIAKNGYTKEPADGENLTYESVEYSENIDELLKSRQDTLEPKAYGYLKEGRGSKKGWTVTFRFSETLRKQSKKDKTEKKEEPGRSVTMDENFEELRVEHKDFILKFSKTL